MDTSEDSPQGWATRSPVGDLPSALVSGKEAAQNRAQWWDPRTPGVSVSLLEGVDSVVCAWAAEQRHQYLGKKFSPDEKREHVAQVRAATERR